MTEALHLGKPLPVGSRGKKSIGFWGVWTLIVTEGSLFGYLLLTYFYLYFQTDSHFPPEGQPALLMPAINTVILLSSSVFVALSERMLCHRRLSLLLMLIAIVLGSVFVKIQLGEWSKKAYGIASNQYGSLYFTITGFHMAHVIVGLIILSLLLLWTAVGHISAKRSVRITIGGLYWHFVDAVWIVIFTSLYLVPYLPGK